MEGGLYGSDDVQSGTEAPAIDARNQPTYPLAEAARYLRLPSATLRSWTVGRGYPTSKGEGRFRPLIRVAQPAPPYLSFWNLIEAHVLRALRTEHGVALNEVRKAIDYAEKSLDVERLLLRRELSSKGGELFLERYGQLINLSASGQLAMRDLLQAYLRRVEWDTKGWPLRLHPFLTGTAAADDKTIAIDPGIAFGRPIVARHGVSTTTIAGRIDAGEGPRDVAADYGMSEEDVRVAVLYERAA